MRVALWMLIVVALGASLAMGSSAFNHVSASRTIGVSIAGDSAAYLALAANGASPHRCFVDVTNGRTSITFDTPSAGCGAGVGTGINAGDGSAVAKYSRYAFHDLLIVTNKASSPIRLWVNSTTSSGGSSALDAAVTSSAGLMNDAAYSTAEPATTINVGSTAFLGVRVKSGTLTGGSVSGMLSLEARR